MFFLRCIRRQITRLQQRLDANRPQLSALARRLAVVFETPETLSNAQAVALTGASRSTLKSRFAELIAAGLIAAQGRGRGAYYSRQRKP